MNQFVNRGIMQHASVPTPGLSNRRLLLFSKNARAPARALALAQSGLTCRARCAPSTRSRTWLACDKLITRPPDQQQCRHENRAGNAGREEPALISRLRRQLQSDENRTKLCH